MHVLHITQQAKQHTIFDASEIPRNETTAALCMHKQFAKGSHQLSSSLGKEIGITMESLKLHFPKKVSGF